MSGAASIVSRARRIGSTLRRTAVDSYDAAWAITIGLMVAGLVVVTAGLLYLAWRVWRHPAVWWRWPALAAIVLGAFGGAVSLAQIAAAV